MKYLAFFVLYSLVACTSARQEEDYTLADLKDSVMYYHDEVMPLIGTLRKVRKDIMKIVVQDSTTLPSDTLSKVSMTEVAERLAQAHDGMWEWMRQFDHEFQGTEEERWQYFQDQLVQIKEVNDVMKKALEAGRKATIEQTQQEDKENY